MNINNLINCFESALKNGARFVGIKIKMPNCPCSEVIINEYPNFEAKLAYYINAYDNDLKLKANSNIAIIGFTYGETYSQIQEDLI